MDDQRSQFPQFINHYSMEMNYGFPLTKVGNVQGNKILIK